MTVSKVVWTEDADNKAWGAKENKREKRGLTREKGMEKRDLRLKTRRLRRGDRVVKMVRMRYSMRTGAVARDCWEFRTGLVGIFFCSAVG